MKKLFSLILFFVFCSIFTSPVFADGSVYNGSNWGVPYYSQDDEQSGEAEEQVWQDELDESNYENYGSDDSPAYLNRQNIDLYESNHGGDSFDLSN